MKLPLLIIAVILMSSGVQGISQSRSCSTVNGRTICEDQQSTGNTAISSSMAMSGPGGSHQDVYAGAGNPGGDWVSGRQRETGGFPGSCDDDDKDDSSYSDNRSGFTDSVLAVSGFGGFPGSCDDDDKDDSSYSDNRSGFTDSVLAVSGFGGFPFQQGSQQGTQQGPQQGSQQGPQQGYQQGPQREYQLGPQREYQQGPQPGYQQGSQEDYPQEQQQQQQPFNPFQFVNRFMNGGGYAGPGFAYAGPGVAYAGPGAAYAGGGVFPVPFPFGRR